MKLSVFDTSQDTFDVNKSKLSVVLKLTNWNNCVKDICDAVEGIDNFVNYTACGIL